MLGIFIFALLDILRFFVGKILKFNIIFSNKQMKLEGCLSKFFNHNNGCSHLLPSWHSDHLSADTADDSPRPYKKSWPASLL